CEQCNRFFARCCHHPDTICLYCCFVFVDGACSRNGQRAVAQAGIGCAMGVDPKDQISLRVTDAMDPGAPRTNQRAELLAALAGLRLLVDADREYHVGSRAHLKSRETERDYIIVGDSEYVVKAITEWIPVWKNNNWLTKEGRRPVNLDLFQRLEAAVVEQENRGLKVQFFHIDREFNSIADGLAKQA
ncbi:ribonuclease H-like domain-containing protein, partial [Mycena crocata]